MGRQLRQRRRQKRQAVRIGRPPRELAGEVDDRILDAARSVFLECGLVGASIDEIARIARAGKPTIYARFPTKEALFAAVALRNAANVRAGFESQTPTGATLEQRLVNVATDMLKRLLVSDVIDFMRLAVAEARRFPELANVGRMARERGLQAVASVLREVAQSDEIRAYPAFATQRLTATTELFIDLVMGRLLMRALFGESLRVLRAEMKGHVSRSVAFFLDGCRQGNSD